MFFWWGAKADVRLAQLGKAHGALCMRRPRRLPSVSEREPAEVGVAQARRVVSMAEIRALVRSVNLTDDLQHL